MERAKKKLAIITSHPIQYNAPLFKTLAERKVIAVKVFYTWGITEANANYDPGFGKMISWDLPLLEGYDYEYLENTAHDKGTHHFNGIINPHIIRQIDEYAPDAIMVYGWNFRSHFKAMRHYKGKGAVYFRGDSTLLNEKRGFSLKKMLRFISLRFVYRYVDYAFYVGENNKKYFLKYGLPLNRLIYAPHVIDNQRFIGVAGEYGQKAAAKRKELGYTDQELVFLYVGKFQDAKNLDLLLDAFMSVTNPSIRLLLVGNGPMEEALKKKAVGDERIGFMGFQNQSEMPIVYRIGDVFVLTSKSETWGLAVNEAMACAKPVLLSDRCGCAEDLVKGGYNGWKFSSGNKDDLQEKINWLIRNRDQVKPMGQHSFDRISEFNFEKVAGSIEASILKLV